MSMSANSWATLLTFATAVIIFIAAIISIVGSIIQLRANIIAAKGNIDSPGRVDDDQRKSGNLNDKYWLLTYFWRKQKFGVLVALVLFWLPFSQARLTGVGSASFIFIMVHSTIMFYGVCYFLLKIAEFELAKEVRISKGAED